MTPEEREAIIWRLNTRCLKWPFVVPHDAVRCGKCEGCIAQRWVERTAPRAEAS